MLKVRVILSVSRFGTNSFQFDSLVEIVSEHITMIRLVSSPEMIFLVAGKNSTTKAWFTRTTTASSVERHVSFFYCSRATLHSTCSCGSCKPGLSVIQFKNNPCDGNSNFQKVIICLIRKFHLFATYNAFVL